MTRPLASRRETACERRDSDDEVASASSDNRCVLSTLSESVAMI